MSLLQLGLIPLLVSMAAGKPNIVIFIADDMGYGDLGCYGNSSVATPNIDSIAQNGAKMTQHLTAASVCTPSRTALLTGRYPVRSGMVSVGAIKVITWMCSKAGLPSREVTFAELTKQAGYRNGYVGKWHLGDNTEYYGDHRSHPLNQGFDYFYGLILTNLEDFGMEGSKVIFNYRPSWNYELIAVWAVTAVSVYCLYKFKMISGALFFVFLLFWTLGVSLPFFLMNNMTLLSSMIHKNYDVVEQPIRLAGLSQRLVNEGVEYITNSTKSDQPFLLVMSWVHMHVFIRTAKSFEGTSQFGRYGDALNELDWSVGQILDVLKRLDILDNTLVYFTSDNGGHLELGTDGGHNGHLKGGKTHGAPDGGIRVPGLIQWPGTFPANTVTDEPTSQMDIFNMVASVSGVDLPKDRQIDGQNIVPLLKGESSVSPHEFLFHYCGNTIHGARYRPKQGATTWKLVTHEPLFLPGSNLCRFVCDCTSAVPLKTPLLYDMSNDPGERTPIDTNSNTYKELFPLMINAMEKQRQSVEPVENQFSFHNLMPRPHWQPCCNGTFPFSCYCTDPKYPE